MSLAVTGVLRALVQAANPAPPPIVATLPELDTRLTGTSDTQRQVLRDLMKDELVPLLAQLQVAPFNFDTAKFAKLQANQSSVAFTPPPLNSIIGKTSGGEPFTATFAQLDHKLARYGIKNESGTVVKLDLRAASRNLADYRDNQGQAWSYPA